LYAFLRAHRQRDVDDVDLAFTRVAHHGVEIADDLDRFAHQRPQSGRPPIVVEPDGAQPHPRRVQYRAGEIAAEIARPGDRHHARIETASAQCAEDDLDP